MADPTAVARKRAIGELRLKKAVSDASRTFGVPFSEVPVQSRREPALASAHFVENVAEFLERITQTKAKGAR
jgi:hypothetical protein